MRKINTLFLFSIAIAFYGCSSSNLASTLGVGALRVMSVSNSSVESVAKRVSYQLDSKNRIAPPNSKYSQRLRKITSNLKLPNYKKDMNYKVYLSPQVNAFALADGSVRVYSGLMDMMSDDELKFVIGHEVGHLYYHHHKKSYQVALASNIIRDALSKEGGDIGSLANSQLGSLAQSLINAQYSQREEKQADAYGLRVLYANGANPYASIYALKKVANVSGGGGLFSDHPAPQERIKALQKLIK